MKTLTSQFAQYAAYHQDRRNLVTHFVGIPLIVLALVLLLSRPALPLTPWLALSPAWALVAGATLYYLRLDLALGLMMAGILLPCLAFGQWLAAHATLAWLGSGIGLFVLGWIFQFAGHLAYEHRKPAFVDDLAGLLIGPLFVLAEALFSFGWRPALRAAIHAEPTRRVSGPSVD
ncbi:DUF962 domain-containing protein [Paraburkholderia bonniea]|uniref:Mpo1 family 2-hydroxy fatty acid dioxygenase n=1 Tax=Paraburkholderia bonniea TaxID=2152891 RepID=UPI001290E136|nr:Mpo1-like protein [Paraburkholderia bonniea]WJF91863.1 DUF962 domain-containing protein [Paraburkholderia bonniea]WJF95182.1 DUF962 domain-containing protein [Paraburkholderia bonniea]